MRERRGMFEHFLLRPHNTFEESEENKRAERDV